MSLRAPSFFAVGLALLCGCAALKPPEPPLLLPTASLESRHEQLKRFSVTQLSNRNFLTSNGEHITQYFSSYIKAVGASDAYPSARWGDWSESGAVLLTLASAMPVMWWRQGGAPDATWAGLGAAGFLLGAGIDYAWTMPQRHKAAKQFNADLTGALGLEPSDAFPVEDAPSDPAGFSFSVGSGYRSLGLEDARDYFGGPAWVSKVYRHETSQMALSWVGRRGWGADLRSTLVNRRDDYTYGNGAQQSIGLSSLELTVGPSLSLQVFRRSDVSLSLGMDVGYAWLHGTDRIADAGDSELGQETFQSQTLCGGPHLRFRRPVLSFMALALDLSYRWERFDGVDVRQASGTLYGATPGHDWKGRPEAWDFSGPQLSFMMEIGRIPFAHD